MSFCFTIYLDIQVLTQTPARRIRCCGCNIQIHMDYRNPVEEKGWHGHSLSERGREGWREPKRKLTPAWTGFYCFSGHITWRMVLIYYAQVHHRWLPFKDNKGKNIANYLKDKDVTAGGGHCSHSILGWFSTDFRKLKILSKHLLPQGEGVLARASLIEVKVQCRPDFPLENLSMDVGPAHQPHSPLAFPSGGWATFPTIGTVPHILVLN